MDAKDLRTSTALSEHNDDGNKYSQSGTIQRNKYKPYQDVGSNSSVKVDTPNSRPCAVIGPDRVLPPSDLSEAYFKKASVEPWPSPDNTYYRPPEYVQKIANYQNPARNISPRQTFQENMQRIMLAPTYSTVKVNDETTYLQLPDRNIPLSNSSKMSVSADSKYCDVPYTVIPTNNDLKTIKNAEICVSNVNSNVTRSVPQGWSPGTINVHPQRPYASSEVYSSYPEYSSCAGPRHVPIPRRQHTIPEEPGCMYPEPYYHEPNIRFKPYPSVKEKYHQPRYDYINNYSNPFHPPPFLPHKYDLQKPIPPHPYPGYPHLKYIDSRISEPSLDGLQGPVNQQSNYSVQYRNQVIHPNYGSMLATCSQGKIPPYPPDSSNKQISSNKLPYDNNVKMYVNYENMRFKPLTPAPDNFYINETSRIHPVKGQTIIPNLSPMMHTIPYPYYKKENPLLKSNDYAQHYKNIKQSIHMSPGSRYIPQFSPNALATSPTDSTASNDTMKTYVTTQEDCGYVSQSSTTSVRSIDSGIQRINDYYGRLDYRYRPVIRSSPVTTKSGGNTNNSVDVKVKKDIDVRQFLQMWNEGDEENVESRSSKELTQKKSIDINYLSKQHEVRTNQEQLYVLGSVDVPREELGKYQHIQRVSKLPENIKGYTNIELLNQFEEVIESSNIGSTKHFQMSTKGVKTKQSTVMGQRPVSPLDVEAKISQSIIHKEVGCNFEIKPCSPKMLNVEVAAPLHNILTERTIEKVTNQLSTAINSPLLPGVEENMTGCKVSKKQKKLLNDTEEISSCKMKNTQFASNNIDSMKNNYTVHDLESNLGVCLASLPRLDNDIELNFPEVNQQFINANKVEAIISTSIKDLTDLDVLNESNNISIETLPTESKIQEYPNKFSTEKEFKKLSQYRKNKTCDSENKVVTMSPGVIRTDSVIIKNPENIKSLSTSREEDQETPINLTSQNEATNGNQFVTHENITFDKEKNKNGLANETAVDFILYKSNRKYFSCNKYDSASKPSKNLSPEKDTLKKESTSNIASVFLHSQDNESVASSDATFIYTNISEANNLEPLIDLPSEPVSKTYNSNENNKQSENISEPIESEISDSSKVTVTNDDFINDRDIPNADSNVCELQDECITKNRFEKQISSDCLIDEIMQDNILSEPVESEISDSSEVKVTNDDFINDRDIPNPDSNIYELQEECITKNRFERQTSSDCLIDEIMQDNTLSEPIESEISDSSEVKITNNDFIYDKNIRNPDSNVYELQDECITKNRFEKQISSDCLIDEIMQENTLSEPVESEISDSSEVKVTNDDFINDRDIPIPDNNIYELKDECTTKYKFEKQTSSNCLIDETMQDNTLSKLIGDKALSIKEQENRMTPSKENDLNQLPLGTVNIDQTKNGTTPSDAIISKFKESDSFNFESEVNNDDVTNDGGNIQINSETINQNHEQSNFEKASSIQAEKTMLCCRQTEITPDTHDAVLQTEILLSEKSYHNANHLNELWKDNVNEIEKSPRQNHNFLSSIVGNVVSELQSHTLQNICADERVPNGLGKYRNRVGNVSKKMYSPWIRKLLIHNEGPCFPLRSSNKISGINKVIDNRKLHKTTNDFLDTKDINNKKIQGTFHTTNDCVNSNSDSKEHKNNNYAAVEDQCENAHNVTKATEEVLNITILNSSCSDEIITSQECREINNKHLGTVSMNSEKRENYFMFLEPETDIQSPLSLNKNDIVHTAINIEEMETKQNQNECDMKQDESKNNLNSINSHVIKSCLLNKSHCSLKRSLSDSAINQLHNDLQDKLGSIENTSLKWAIKRKKVNYIENTNDSNLIAQKLCNILQNRRNSISSIYNDENVSFCILIDDNCVIAEEEEVDKICYTEYPEDYLEITDDLVTEEKSTVLEREEITCIKEKSCDYSESFLMQCDQEKSLDDSWVQDVACIETVVSDDIAEDIMISAPSSPKNYDLSDNEEYGVYHSNISEHTNKVKYIYGEKMCSDDAHLVETLYNTPQMDVNKTLITREHHIFEPCIKYYDTESLEKILSESNSHFETSVMRENNDFLLSSNDVICLKAHDNKENMSNISSPQQTIENDNKAEPDVTNTKAFETTQDDTVNSCESSNDNIFSYTPEEEIINYTTPRSPEVSSTTSEERNASILLKIKNYKGSITSHFNEININTNQSSCKFTEKGEYIVSNATFKSTRPLITKAAQKYIPPLKESIRDLKIKLPLPQKSLLRLKQLKLAKDEPKLHNKYNKNIPVISKKSKPKFEDVLKSIDEIQFKMHKEKNKKSKKAIPKVVIKKNENGSHYASTSDQDTYNPDLTGRKWQPWVFIEKNHFVDKMALKKKNKAVFNHRKNAYVLAEKFYKYKSVNSTKFFITQQKFNTSSTGQLKYTIKLKHNY